MIALLLALLAAGPRQHLGPPSPERARRVVTLAPSLAEVVLALDAGDRLVGVTRFDDDARVAKLPRIGGYNDPQPEAVLAVKPDLVLAEPAPANRGPVETVARLGVPIEAFPLSTVQDIEQAIEGIARLLGVADRGRAVNAAIERARTQARNASAGKPRIRTLLVFGLDPLVVAGRTGFAGELLEDAGGENAAGNLDKPFFRFSAEAAVRAAPEVIVLCGVDTPAGRAPVPGLEKTRTARLRSTALMHPGPRIPEALDDLAAALRP
ncbi:MAG: ABC transporter substrate-binding protein [Myxococcales bacterium]|nr:helical backbone metal receptor [Myxococcales bacterium]